ncbi:hypothetical protein C7H84_08775 [Burkholderia sp. Nafp2/4-1b]|nr:hypothetical protein C7H84_08775 [Burkholderia sp. Nafp2/4-1b]
MEETCGGCRSATTNEAHYTNGFSTAQENLHCEIQNHNAGCIRLAGARHIFPFEINCLGKNRGIDELSHLEQNP